VDEKVDIHMPFFIGDYLADTTDLTTEEHGAYLLILMDLWRRRGATTSDHAKLARIAKLTPAKWRTTWETLSRFFVIEGDTLRQKRLTKELEKAVGRRKAASESGARGAAKRWGGHGDPIGYPTGEPIVSPMANGMAKNSSLSSPSESSRVAPAIAVPPDWSAGVWLGHFSVAWCREYRQQSYGAGSSDAKACGSLSDILAALGAAERRAAQERAPAMFAEFFGGRSPETISRRHPFVFFVTAFNGLRAEKKAAQAIASERCYWHGKGNRGPSRQPLDTCPECREEKARNRGRSSEPTPFVPLKPPENPMTAEQLAEIAAARKGGAAATGPPPDSPASAGGAR